MKNVLLVFVFLLSAMHLSADSLYHGSLTDSIEILEPNLRYTPGEEENSPAGIYASNDPAFAAAHAFPWSSDEGVDLYYDEEGLVLAVPPKLFCRLFNPVFIYEVPADTFELLQIPPQGRNYRSVEPVKCLSKMRFDNVIVAIQHYGGKFRVTGVNIELPAPEESS